MSYILDALRRAEAQRSRGRLPGLHEAVAGAIPAGQPATAPRRWLALGLLLLLIGLSAIGVALLFQPATIDSNAGAVPAAPEPASVGAPVAVAAGPLPAASAPVAPAPSLALPRKAVLAEPPAAPAAPTAAAAPPERPAAKVTGAGGAQEGGPAAATAKPTRADEQKSAPATAPAPATSAALPTRQELPADIRRRLPSIVVSGTVYSSDPAQRMLVVNGELWREGDQVGPELVLEQIRRRDAVLRFRDQRFTVSP